MQDKNYLDALKFWFIYSTYFEHYYALLQEYISEYRFLVSKTWKNVNSEVCSTGVVCGHKKAVLTNVLLKMGKIMLETC
jgi:hypothetical protein